MKTSNVTERRAKEKASGGGRSIGNGQSELRKKEHDALHQLIIECIHKFQRRRCRHELREAMKESKGQWPWDNYILLNIAIG